jgi:hypothetical protein
MTALACQPTHRVWLMAMTIMTAMSGVARISLTAVLQDSARTGSSPVKSSATSPNVATAMGTGGE